MKRILLPLCCGLLYLALAPTAFGQLNDSPSGGAQQVAIPSYIYPCSSASNCYWTQLLDGSPTVGLVIINPFNGPGSALDLNYRDQVQRARARGVKILGYVHTIYGHRTLPNVKADIERYYTWYDVDGIFVDEASTACWQRKYYANLYNFVKARGGIKRSLVALNPGTNTSECYLTTQTGDIFVTFEGTFSAYLNWQPQGWEINYPAQRFWHLVYQTNETQVSQAVCLSKQRHAGYIYVTDDDLPNPWDMLPLGTAWNTLLQLAAAITCPAIVKQ